MNEGTKRVWYPPLVAVYPVLALYAANVDLFPLPYLWRPLLVSLLAGIALWGAFGLILRSWERGALVASVAVVAFHTYRLASGAIPAFWGTGVVLGGWLVGLLMAMAIAAFAAPKVTQALNAVCLLLVVFATGQVVLGVFANRQQNQSVVVQGATVARPDVFYIVLDGYGRADAIKKGIGFDNSPFVRELERRGFFLPERTRSNYCQTELSVGSSLNMEPIQALLPETVDTRYDRSPLANLVNDNAVSRRFRELGYQYIAVPTGFPAFTFRTADLVAEGSGRLSLLEATLLDRSPFIASASVMQSLYDVRRSTLQDAFGQLRQLARKGTRPRFVVAHILMPHPPFVFGPNGEKVRQGGNYGLFDGSDYMAFVGDRASYQAGYTGQLQYLNQQILQVLDELQGQPGEPPIIILQGDHGSKAGLDQNDLAKTDLDEVFPILNAYFVPSDVRKEIPEDVTPVNSFRILLRTLFGDRLPNLPNQSWYSPYAEPFEFTDVTSRIRLP